MSTTAAETRTPAPAPAPSENVVEFREVWKGYGGRDILAGVNLKIRKGEVMCVLGPSGTGKSVTLRHINGLTMPDQGDVIVFGESVVGLTEEQLAPTRRRVAMLFQGGALFDSMNVEQNIAFPVVEHTDRPSTTEATDHGCDDPSQDTIHSAAGRYGCRERGDAHSGLRRQDRGADEYTSARSRGHLGLAR